MMEQEQASIDGLMKLVQQFGSIRCAQGANRPHGSEREAYNGIRAYAHRLQQPCPASVEGWRTIESAPHYTEVLCWREDQGVFISQLTTPEGVMSEEELEKHEHEFPDDFEEWFHPVWGWQEGDLRPTHWMPLPAEPLSAPSSRGTEAQADNGYTEVHVDHLDRLECCRRLLEMIAVGDSADPAKDAEQELVAHGFWTPRAGAAPTPAAQTTSQSDRELSPAPAWMASKELFAERLRRAGWRLGDDGDGLGKVWASLSARLSGTASADSAASVDALDALRYRWLRSIGHAQLNVMAHHAGDALDASIDAAMKGEAK